MTQSAGSSYRIEFLERVETEDLPALSRSTVTRIFKAIDERLKTSPLLYGKPLRFSWKGHRRIRTGKYRIIYRVEENARRVLIVRIEHCEEVYDE